MIERDKIINYLSQYLECSRYADYAPNGLQVEGAAEIHKICSAVSVSLDVIEQAAIFGADLLMVHHGFFWKGESPVLTGMKGRRIARLFQNNINLLAYHLPLDTHKILGNNVLIGKLLNIDEVTSHPANQIQDLLWTGKLKQALSPQAFKLQLEYDFNQSVIHISPNNQPISRLGWCTGAAQDLITDAAALELDAYISGEISERTYYQAKELGIHYFACGHHATERLGIQALGTHIADIFGLEHYFIDEGNPV